MPTCPSSRMQNAQLPSIFPSSLAMPFTMQCLFPCNADFACPASAMATCTAAQSPNPMQLGTHHLTSTPPSVVVSAGVSLVTLCSLANLTMNRKAKLRRHKRLRKLTSTGMDVGMHLLGSHPRSGAVNGRDVDTLGHRAATWGLLGVLEQRTPAGGCAVGRARRLRGTIIASI